MRTKKIIAVFIIATFIVALMAGCDSNKKPYEEAEALLNDKHYEEAITMFEALGGYKDSTERAKEALEKAKGDRLSSLWVWSGLSAANLRMSPFDDGVFKPDGKSKPNDLSEDELDSALGSVFPGLHFSSSITGRSDGQERFVFSNAQQFVQVDLKDGEIAYARVVDYDGTTISQGIMCGMSLEKCLEILNLPLISLKGKTYEELFPQRGKELDSYTESSVEPPCVYVRRDADIDELTLVLASPAESIDDMINELDFFFDKDGILIQWSLFAYD